MVVIVADHPHLRQEDNYAPQEFAADYLADECCNFGLVMPLRDAGHDNASTQYHFKEILR